MERDDRARSRRQLDADAGGERPRRRRDDEARCARAARERRRDRRDGVDERLARACRPRRRTRLRSTRCWGSSAPRHSTSGRDGIRVNAIGPGPVATGGAPRAARAPRGRGRPDGRARRCGRPQRARRSAGMVTEEDVARAALFLACDLSSGDHRRAGARRRRPALTMTPRVGRVVNRYGDTYLCTSPGTLADLLGLSIPELVALSRISDAPGRIRTSDPRIRSPLLCPLSYGRMPLG